MGQTGADPGGHRLEPRRPRCCVGPQLHGARDSCALLLPPGAQAASSRQAALIMPFGSDFNDSFNCLKNYFALLEQSHSKN